MTQEDILKMTTEQQVTYWTGCLLIAIGCGKFRDEVYNMIDFYQRTAYEHGAKSK